MHHPVGVLLRVDHPDHQIDEAEQAVHLQPVRVLDGVEVGQVEQDQPVQRRLVVAVEQALPHEPVAGQHTEPVEQSGATVEWAPDAGVGDTCGGPAYPDG
ncbi:hypothetical protein GCM10029963_45410 [Micromonospora andamanensis]